MSIPLFLSFLFRDRLRGFLTVLSGLSIFHLALALLTQAFQVFSYGFIISVHAVVASLALAALVVKRREIARPLSRLNWLPILAVLIVGFQFWSVHYSFTGTLSTQNGFEEVSSSRYAYPYYSDEWVGVSIIRHSIENESLPFTNSLWPEARFPNPTFPFFSFFAEIFLLLRLDPLTAYPVLAILSGLLISFLPYLILRKSGVGSAAALLIPLSLPYIVNGANLPGLWYFIPFSFGLIMLLLCLLSFVSGRKGLALTFSVLAVVFYPPMIAFSLPIALAGLLEDGGQGMKRGALIAAGSLFVIFLSAAMLIFQSANPVSLWHSVWPLISRDNLQVGIPRFDIFTIIPVWLLVFGIFGFWNRIREKKYLLILPTVIGLMFWVIYSGTQKVFIIEYQRVIIVVSVLIALLSGFGLQFLLDFIAAKYRLNNTRLANFVLPFALLLLFAAASLFYTQHTDWKKLVMQIGLGEEQIKVTPSAPANTYLTPEDLALFQKIRKQRFIAPPWKGLVIGAATENYPVESKASTITNHFFDYADFMSASCQRRYEVAKRIGISYAYSEPLACPNFVEIGKSEEGLVLYKFEE